MVINSTKENAMKKLTITPENVRDIRKKLYLNQSQFWSPISVTQSVGSRYESGRNIPKTVQTLIRLAYGSEAEAVAVLAELRKLKA
jgi:DNA-binding transcriptional regulator YiaG